MIGYWNNPVVSPSVRVSVCAAVHCGSQGLCTGLKVVPACTVHKIRHAPICSFRHFCCRMFSKKRVKTLAWVLSDRDNQVYIGLFIYLK